MKEIQQQPNLVAQLQKQIKQVLEAHLQPQVQSKLNAEGGGRKRYTES